MIRPEPLKKGDKIGLIGTCSPPRIERIEPAVNWIKSLGIDVVIGKSVYENHYEMKIFEEFPLRECGRRRG